MSRSVQLRALKAAGVLFLALLTAAHAGSHASADYAVIADTSDAGGARTGSAAYTNDGGVGAVGGLSNVASPVEFDKSGYIGQLYDVTGLTLGAVTNPPAVNGGATLQLTASQVLDDASLLGLPASAVAWSVVSGPISGITTAGLATGTPVSQDTAATAQGVNGSFSATLGITVRAMGTLPVTNLAANGATLNGNLNPAGSGTTVYFEYGTTTAYGQMTTITNLGNGTSPVPFSVLLAGLAPGTTYDYRLVVINADGTTDYANETFTTPAQVPVMPGWGSIALALMLMGVAANSLRCANPRDRLS